MWCRKTLRCYSGLAMLSKFSSVVEGGIADFGSYICNWMGVQNVANAVAYPGHVSFAAKPLHPYTVNGAEKGSFKTQDNLSFLKVSDAGHMVMYYREYP